MFNIEIKPAISDAKCALAYTIPHNRESLYITDEWIRLEIDPEPYMVSTISHETIHTVLMKVDGIDSDIRFDDLEARIYDNLDDKAACELFVKQNNDPSGLPNKVLLL